MIQEISKVLLGCVFETSKEMSICDGCVTYLQLSVTLIF